MVEEDIDNWQEMLGSTIPIYSHIFGFEPVMEPNLSSDLDINTSLCIPLGVISRELDNIIISMAKGLQKIFQIRNGVIQQ